MYGHLIAGLNYYCRYGRRNLQISTPFEYSGERFIEIEEKFAAFELIILTVFLGAQQV
jgi:hypothetical protein